MSVGVGRSLRSFFPEFGMIDRISLTQGYSVASVNGEKKSLDYEVEDGDWVFFANSKNSFDQDDRDVVLEWLRYENYLRTAPWTQEALAQLPNEDDWMDVITDLTFRKVVDLIEVSDREKDRLINVMKTAAERWSDDKRFINVSIWRKHNRAEDVKFKVGEKAPVASIIPVRKDGTHGFPIDVAVGSGEKPVIIISSSIT